MKIFISSTFDDLKEHRDSVRNALLRLGYQPVEMEYFGSRAESWNEAALNAINGCDAFIGIYAYRYGFIPKGEMLSITEQEFDKAQALGIPCFCYRIDSNHPWLPKFVDRGQSGKRLLTFMEKTNKILRSQFTTPENLANQVSADLGRQFQTTPKVTFRAGSAPPLPTLIVGRDNVIADLKLRLGVAAKGESATIQAITVIRGWPGVGKTTIAATLAHDPDIAKTYSDGILWVSLGTKPNLLSELAAWGRALGTDDLLRAKSVEEASAQLTAMLRNKKMLLIVDDVWESEHARAFQVGGRDCAMLITTRQSSIAQALASNPNDIYKLPVLTDTEAIELLKILAPTVVAKYPNESLDLVHDLEGLPLAIQVAGHLLNTEASYGFGVTDLLKQLREGARLLEAQAPADRAELANETTPTVAALLKQSTDRLDDFTRDCFAYLGPFAPKPATFDLEAMKAVWQVEDPRPTVKVLVDRGLLEYVPAMNRYQMNRLLVMHANSLLTH